MFLMSLQSHLIDTQDTTGRRDNPNAVASMITEMENDIEEGHAVLRSVDNRKHAKVTTTWRPNDFTNDQQGLI